MAIYNGPMASKMRGKVGEIVAAKTVGGQTALRAYQPKVKNPNTLRQQNSRMRMKLASGLAAMLGDVLGVGYAQAVKGLKMYPRNMFVSGAVKVSEDSPISYELGEYDISYGKVAVSKSAGLSVVPAVGQLDFTTAGSVKLPVTVPAPASSLGENHMGVVVCVLLPELKMSIVEQAVVELDTETNVTVDVPAAYAGQTAHVYAFAKVVPESANNISTDTMPWKFPSETSATVYVGTGNLS